MKIEKNIPLVAAKPPRERVYPFADMSIGDSLFFEGIDHKSNPASAARKWSQRHDQKFSCRNVEGGLRIWRTE